MKGRIQPVVSSRNNVAFWKASLTADGGRQEAGDSVQVRSPLPCRIVSMMVWSLRCNEASEVCPFA
jgi:hypothetical protein